MPAPARNIPRLYDPKVAPV